MILRHDPSKSLCCPCCLLGQVRTGEERWKLWGDKYAILPILLSCDVIREVRQVKGYNVGVGLGYNISIAI